MSVTSYQCFAKPDQFTPRNGSQLYTWRLRFEGMLRLRRFVFISYKFTLFVWDMRRRIKERNIVCCCQGRFDVRRR
ncbi:hypothetical protein V5799_025210 [Amblyomma americanum]|uniref:Uncharacterized protein n=1 Tax=Amblyomma americanum TaxID=6943 RepID=A0AAQ4E9Y9_AMBAM